jgi:diguanylate cyclase (GGDEF)-like protein
VLAGLVQRYLSELQVKAREIQDPSTNLATPEYLHRRLEEEVIRCRELGHSMSLVTFRLNELPEYVEQFGEDFRQRCRQELAGLAAAWRCPTELVGHGRGESLVVILPSARREKAQARAEAFAQLVRKHNFPRRKRMTVEFGVGTYPADAEESQELMEYVDKSLQEGPGAHHGFPAQAIAL